MVPHGIPDEAITGQGDEPRGQSAGGDGDDRGERFEVGRIGGGEGEQVLSLGGQLGGDPDGPLRAGDVANAAGSRSASTLIGPSPMSMESPLTSTLPGKGPWTESWRASDPGKAIGRPAKSLRGALGQLKIVEAA